MNTFATTASRDLDGAPSQRYIRVYRPETGNELPQ